jgi:alpha-D-xyloside xylohydrolase
VKRRIVSLLAPAFVASLSGCSGESTQVTTNDVVKTISLAGGTTVTLFRDGGLEIADADQIIVKRGHPVFSVFKDDRTRFHDPTSLGAFTFDPVDATAIEMTEVGTTGVKLHLADRGNGAALVSFAIPTDDGAYLGLGERFDHVDAKGKIVPMFLTINGGFESGTNDAHVPVPLVIDTQGYGFFVDSPATGAFDVGATEPDVLRATFDQTDMTVELLLPAPRTPAGVLGLYAKQTALPRRPPLWSLAPMHWRNEWTDAKALLGDLDQYRTRHIPASTVWIDNPWETSYNDATLDSARFGDTAAMMKSIAAKGFRTIAWSTPYLDHPMGAPTNAAQKLYKEADAKGFLIKSDGKTWDAIGCCVKSPGMIDFTSAGATSFWEDVLASATHAGFAGFKLDYGEDLIPALLGGRLGIQFADGETERTARTYPLDYHDAYEHALAKVRSDTFVIARASGIRGSAHVEAIWPGDLDNGFEVHDAAHVGGLPAAIVAGQTLAASNFPTFGSDIGGFRDGMPKREALLRWAEYAAFGVIMELGGGGDSHNPWAYDEDAATIYGGLARAHFQLVPYLDSLLAAAAKDGTPTIRSLPFEFPDDEEARAFADDEYLLGPDFLVAPVVAAGVTSREVYFPNATWVHWFTHERFGPQKKAVVKAPIGTPPVFVKSGALIPMFGPTLDTLVGASEAGIVGPAANLDDEAVWVPDGIAAFATWPSGDAVKATTDGFSIEWTSAGKRGLFVTIDMQAAPFHADQVSIPKAKELASEALVRSAKGFAFSFDAKRNLVFLRLDPNRSARLVHK